MPIHYHWCWGHCMGINIHGINLAITEYSGISTRKVKLGIPPNNSLCGLVTTYDNTDLGKHWLQCLLPDSSTWLSWLILAYHQRCCVAFTWEWFKKVLMELCKIFCQNIVFCSSSVSGMKVRSREHNAIQYKLSLSICCLEIFVNFEIALYIIRSALHTLKSNELRLPDWTSSSPPNTKMDYLKFQYG